MFARHASLLPRVFPGRRWCATLCVALCLGVTCGLMVDGVVAQQRSDPRDESLEITTKQKSLSDAYKLLEQKLFQLHEYESSSNPDRSRLLKEAFEKSQSELTHEQLEAVVQSLADKDWKTAISGQENALEDLQQLLELLESEDRGKRIRDRQDQVRRYIAEVDRLMRLQRGIRGQNEGGVESDRLAKSQAQAAERAARLGKQIDQDQAPADQRSPSKHEEPGEDPEKNRPDDSADPDDEKEDDYSKPNDPDAESKGEREGDPTKGEEPKDKTKGDQPDDKEPGKSDGGDSQPNESEPNESEPGSEKGDAPPNGESQNGQPQPGQRSEGQPSDGQPGQSDSAQPQPPRPEPAPEDRVRKRIQAAEDRMREARKNLDDAQREQSADAMRKAEEELAEAKKELEEILRQLREEEVERSLAMLEGRFRRMLEQEIRILEKTKLYDKTAANKRDSEFEIRAGKLGVEQRNVAADADRALLVLREDGSSIAFPETVMQMRDDMYQVAARLSAGKVNAMTQEIEQDIIDALNDLIEALIQAQEDADSEAPPSPPPSGQQPGQQDEQPLVDQIAELKMIRGLQMRINKRHKRYAAELDDPQDPVGFSDDPEIEAALQRLGERQEKIQSITRDIVLGKNK